MRFRRPSAQESEKSADDRGGIPAHEDVCIGREVTVGFGRFDADDGGGATWRGQSQGVEAGPDSEQDVTGGEFGSCAAVSQRARHAGIARMTGEQSVGPQRGRQDRGNAVCQLTQQQPCVGVRSAASGQDADSSGPGEVFRGDVQLAVEGCRRRGQRGGPRMRVRPWDIGFLRVQGQVQHERLAAR
ncbi:hypothetical protein K4749_39120 [Streptomyces sp. TRM72054]|nr:hypothetical protein [Streptomyces sp. TRM72054]MBX9399398.1 hypothetical protein [Streptomyces sp. TRM72054]